MEARIATAAGAGAISKSHFGSALRNIGGGDGVACAPPITAHKVRRRPCRHCHHVRHLLKVVVRNCIRWLGPGGDDGTEGGMGREEGAWEGKRDGKGGERGASLRGTINHSRRRRPLLHGHGCWRRMKTILKLGAVGAGGGGGAAHHGNGTAYKRHQHAGRHCH